MKIWRCSPTPDKALNWMGFWEMNCQHTFFSIFMLLLHVSLLVWSITAKISFVTCGFQVMTLSRNSGPKVEEFCCEYSDFYLKGSLKCPLLRQGKLKATRDHVPSWQLNGVTLCNCLSIGGNVTPINLLETLPFFLPPVPHHCFPSCPGGVFKCWPLEFN